MHIVKTQNQERNLFIPYFYLISSMNIIFYPFIKRWNGYIDELTVLFLFFIGYRSLRFQKGKEFYIILFILVFYLLYSLLWGQNVYKAAILDFLLFLKPFISFFIPLLVPFQISERRIKYIRKFYFCCGFLCVLQLPFLNQIYSNTAGYYQCCIVSGLSYLLFSNYSRKDYFYALLFFTAGLASIRAKFFTEYIFIIFVVYFLHSKIRINLKWIIVTGIIAGVSIYVSWEKFNMYFISGVDNEAVRSLFYAYTPNVMMDYFPLGPGFGTFNTEAAAQFYSPLYVKYGLDYIWGMREIDYHTDADFLHDTFYPALSQFGILGFILYFWFWMRRWKEAFALNMDVYKLFIIVFFIMVIQNLADNSFTGAVGISYMMMLGIILTKEK